MNGCNFKGTTVESLIEETDKGITKGYYHWIELYKGKTRDQPNLFSMFGKGFSVVGRAVVEMGLRFQGYFLVCDSWYVSIPLLNQMFYWDVNFLGTIKLNRKGLRGQGTDEKPFHDLKKLLERSYDYKTGGEEGAQLPSERGKKKKYQGFKRGHCDIRKARGNPLVVCVQKDNKVMTEASNSIPVEKRTTIHRYNKTT